MMPIISRSALVCQVSGSRSRSILRRRHAVLLGGFAGVDGGDHPAHSFLLRAS